MCGDEATDLKLEPPSYEKRPDEHTVGGRLRRNCKEQEIALLAPHILRGRVAHCNDQPIEKRV